MSEIQKLLNKEITKKKFDKDFILKNKDVLHHEIKSKKYTCLLEKALHEGSDELFELLLEKKIVNKENVFSLLKGFSDTYSQRFMNLLPLVALGESAVFLSAPTSSKILNGYVRIEEDEQHIKKSYARYQEVGINIYEAEMKILAVRNLLIKIIEDKNTTAMLILKKNRINFDILKSYSGLSTCKYNLIEPYIHNAEIDKLEFIFKFDYTPVIQDLCYINGNKSNEENLKLIELYDKCNSVRLDKSFYVIVETRPQNYQEILVTLPAYLLDNNKQIRSSFLNEILKNPGSQFSNSHFSVYHDKSYAIKRDLPKIFKLFNLDFNLQLPVDKKNNIFRLIEKEFDPNDFDEKFWFKIIEKLKSKNFDFNSHIYSYKSNNFLSYLINLNTKSYIYGKPPLNKVISYAINELKINPHCYIDEGNTYGPAKLKNNPELLRSAFNTGHVNSAEFIFSILSLDTQSNRGEFYGKKYSIEEEIEKSGINEFIKERDFYEGINKFIDVNHDTVSTSFIDNLIQERIKFENILLKENIGSIKSSNRANRI